MNARHVALVALTSSGYLMADVIVQIRVMPDGPDVNLSALQSQVEEKIKQFGATLGKVETQPVAFGIIALMFVFAYDEKRGMSDELEENIKSIEGVQNVEVVDVRRAFG